MLKFEEISQKWVQIDLFKTLIEDLNLKTKFD